MSDLRFPVGARVRVLESGGVTAHLAGREGTVVEHYGLIDEDLLAYARMMNHANTQLGDEAIDVRVDGFEERVLGYSSSEVELVEVPQEVAA